MDEEYFEAIRTWRKEYENKLGAPDGWLSISGLYWLTEGENRIGSDPKSAVILPAGSAPRHVALIHLAETKLTFTATGEAEIVYNDQPVASLDIRLNDVGSSDAFFLNDLKFFVIQRGTRYGVRVYDKNNPARRKFHNVRWFPVEEALRIEAAFIPLDPPLTLSISNVIGSTSDETCPGYAEFTLNDQLCRLYPVPIGDGRLWFMFRDASNGGLSYGGGRFLTAPEPKDGTVVLDFNRAYNPPCAYTDFATCPLPPTVNTLAVGLLAGEMAFVGH